VTCYLWRTTIHPFNIKAAPGLGVLTSPLYTLYRRYPNQFIDQAISAASTIIVESGLGAVLLERARSLNRSTKLIYYASDTLDMIGAHPFVQRCLEQSGDFVDHVCLASARMASQFRWIEGRLYVVPHGINTEDFADALPTPYSSCELNAVSVGSGLFDSRFFSDVAPAFPNIQFHVIGAGTHITPLSNMRVYREMKFRDTVPFIAHASFGIAPYRAEATAGYVCDSSMKLMQYEYVGIPAVCPEFAVGRCASRFGYIPGNLASIEKAIAAALAARNSVQPRRDFLSWTDVAHRILDPETFEDTYLVDAHPAV
jgi:2-beta-glucuronyltransferase